LRSSAVRYSSKDQNKLKSHATYQGLPLFEVEMAIEEDEETAMQWLKIYSI
jgi:hypothetical protein